MIPEPRLSLDLIRRLLHAKGWVLMGESDGAQAWQPPYDVGLPSSYRLHLPRTDETPGGVVAAARVSAILADLYEAEGEELAAQAGGNHAVLALRLKSPDYHGGSVPFLNFEAMVERLRKTLLHTASFVLNETPTISDVPEEAHQYLARCRFLQTSVGSYIARVQLPEAEPLLEPTLFEEELSSRAVTERLLDSLAFVTGRVFDDDRSIYTDEVMEEEAPTINVDVFRDIGELLQKSGAKSVDFTLTSAAGVSIIPSGPLSDYRLQRLDSFVAFAKERLAADRNIDVIGRIVELRSRRPDRRRNHVGIAAVLDGREVFIALTMGKQDYPYAVMAHNRNRMVRLQASVRQMKTQLRVIRLGMFEELDQSAEGVTAP